MKIIVIAVILVATISANAQVSKEQTTASGKQKMTPLFNGRNLSGWYSFLVTKGKNNDPEKIFSIEDGLLHISGKEFGYISTEKVYSNFHLAVEFKWGIKKYPPRDADTTKRDNGICYYLPADQKDTVWPKSLECQIQEGDVGDLWLIGGTSVEIDGKRTTPKDYEKVQKKADGELPNGQWNRVEVIADKGKLTYIVNGIIVNEAKSPSLTEGKILIQSEGAEIYYRKIEIAELN